MFDLDDVFARNRLLFGDFRMEADDDKDGDTGSGDDAGGDDSNADGSDDTGTGDDATGDDKSGTDALGDPGKQALDRMKARLKKEREARAAAEKALAEANKPGDDDKPDLDKIRAEAKAEAEIEGLRGRVMDKIEAKAGARFGIDTEDVAVMLLRRHELEDFIDDGKIDVDAITEALNDLLEKQPRLAAVAQGDKKFQGGADGGARGKAGKPQLTEADVKKLAAEGKHREIEEARVDGRLNELLGIK